MMARLGLVLLLVALSGCASVPESPARMEILTLADQTFGRTRAVRVYLPVGYDNSRRRYPVLYLFDGQNLFDAALSKYSHAEWQADETATRLIAEKKIEPLIIVGIDSPPDPGRAEEYLPYAEPYVKLAAEDAGGGKLPEFFTDDVFPLIEGKFRTSSKHRGLGGSSFGGIATLAVLMRAPGMFSRALVESPSLWVADGQMLKDVKAAPADRWPERIFIGMGGRENSRGACDAAPDEGDRKGVEAVETLRDSLARDGLGADRLKLVVDECEVHSETAWAKRFPAALEFLYRR